MLLWVEAVWRMWEGHSSLWGNYPSASKEMGDLSLQEEGDAGRGEVGPSDGFGAALSAKPRGGKGQKHSSQGTLLSKALYFSFASSEFPPSLRKLMTLLSVLKQPDFLEEHIISIRHRHGQIDLQSQSGLRSHQNGEAGKCLQRKKIFLQTLTEGEMIVNHVDTEGNTPTNSACNMIRNNEQVYLPLLYQSHTSAKIPQVTSNNAFSSRCV